MEFFTGADMNVGKRKRCPKCGNALTDNAVFCERCGARIFGNANGQESVDPYLHTVIDDTFEIESILGTGSMGIVYKAWHRMMKCHVALKVLRQDFVSDKLILQRFQREAEAANKLSHPNVIRVLHFGWTHLRAPYIVMECLEGIELAQLVLQEFPLSQRRICILAIQIARALRAAHAANIIHRDLKPANIVIVNQPSGEELIKVLDFGIAKIAEGKGEGLTREGAICGTPAFMSPEQILGKKVTPATDIFSFGTILYYMLTCKLPFPGTELLELAATIVGTDPTPPSKTRLDTYVDPNLEAICMRALQKNIEDRFASSAELVEALENILPHIPFVNPNVRPKVVVGSPLGQKVDQNAKTRFEVPIVQDSDLAQNENGVMSPSQIAEDDESNTEDNNVIPGSPAYPGYPVKAAQMPLMGKARVSPTAPTLLEVPEIPDAIPGVSIKKRKKLLALIVILVIVVCLLVFVVILGIKKHQLHDSNSCDDCIPVESEMQAEQAAKAAASQLLSKCETIAPEAKAGVGLGVVYGLIPELEQFAKAKAADDLGNAAEQQDASDAEQQDALDAEQQDALDAEQKDAANDNDDSANPSNAGQKPSKAKRDSAPSVKKTNTAHVASALKKARNLEASKKKAQACAIYKQLSKESSLSSSERNQVNSGLRRCQR